MNYIKILNQVSIRLEFIHDASLIDEEINKEYLELVTLQGCLIRLIKLEEK